MKTILGVSIVCMAFMLTGCSGHLSRSRAKTQLDELAKQALSQTDSAPHSLLVQIGTISRACEKNLAKGYDPVESQAEYPILAATGYLTMQSIKPHVWRIELTERGKKSIVGEPYAHEEGRDCDRWQVTMPLAKFDHLEITGIMEEGVHAKVDVSVVFAITQVGLDARKVAEKYVFDTDKKTFGDELAHQFLSSSLTVLLSDDLVYAGSSAKTYVKHGSAMFDKYDDGWKVNEHSFKESDDRRGPK